MYAELKDAWRLERSSFKLQRIPSDLYRRVRDYLRQLEDKRSKEASSIMADLLLIERELIKKLVLDLFELRVFKALNLALEGLQEELKDLVDEERAAVEGLLGLIENFKEQLLEEKGEELTLILITKDTPTIIEGGKVYGPFKEQEIAFLPLRVAMRLIEEGLAIKL